MKKVRTNTDGVQMFFYLYINSCSMLDLSPAVDTPTATACNSGSLFTEEEVALFWLHVI
jgi:hypothetical protein